MAKKNSQVVPAEKPQVPAVQPVREYITNNTQLIPGTPITGHVMQMYSDLAVKMFRSNVAPLSLESPEAVFVAQMKLHSMGVDPIAHLDSVYVIRNKVTLYGELPLAMAYKSKKLLSFTKEITGKGDTLQCKCTAVRLNEDPTVQGGFSKITQSETVTWAMAVKAGWTKNQTYSKTPERMLYFRAMHFLLRDLFPDVLAGMNLGIEGDEIIDVTPNVQTAVPAAAEEMKAKMLAAEAKSEPVVEPESQIQITKDYAPHNEPVQPELAPEPEPEPEPEESPLPMSVNDYKKAADECEAIPQYSELDEAAKAQFGADSPEYKRVHKYIGSLLPEGE